MSLITSCPACGTMFRVVPDQLKISEGWVRCGHCQEVFDATANLAEEASASAPVPLAPSQPPARSYSPEPPTMPASMATQPAPIDSLPRTVSQLSAPVPLPAEEPEGDFDSQSLEASDLDAPFVFRRSDLVEPEPARPLLPPARARAADSRFPAQDEVQAPELDDVSFVRQARRKAFWRRPMVRVALAFVSLLLAALLVLQLAYDDRDRIAVLQPRLRPVLELMCEQLQCTLAPPRQIEAVVIESSGFNRLRSDAYRLSFTLRNNAGMSVAAPAIELTLTDNQDQPVLRRVLTPAELGARDNVIAAGGEWSGSVGLVLTPNGSGRIAGYRLLAFYP